MARQGSCLDPTPDALTVLDRLAGLSKVISPAVMEQAPGASGSGASGSVGGIGPGRPGWATTQVYPAQTQRPQTQRDTEPGGQSGQFAPQR